MLFVQQVSAADIKNPEIIIFYTMSEFMWKNRLLILSAYSFPYMKQTCHFNEFSTIVENC